MAAKPPVRVAVVGDGVAACACTWGLVTEAEKAKQPISVSLLGLSAAGGGLCATRHPGRHGIDGLYVNYGPQVFHVSKTNTKTIPLVEALHKAGHLEEWLGSFGQIETATGEKKDAMHTGLSDVAPFLSLRAPNLGEAVTRYRGLPGMWSMSHGMLDLAAAKAKTAGDEVTCETRFGTLVNTFQPVPLQGGARSDVGGWELFGPRRKSLGIFDWVVITDQPRTGWWSPKNYDFLNTDGGGLRKAAQEVGNTELNVMVNQIAGRFMNVPTTVVMLAWNLREQSEAETAELLESLKALPFDISEVKADEVLLVVARQSLGPDYAIVTLYSTAAYSDLHKTVNGSHSSSTNAQGYRGKGDGGRHAGEEDQVVEEMLSAFSRVLTSSGAKKTVAQLPTPSWGPVLSRWSQSFVEEVPTNGRQEFASPGGAAEFVPKDNHGWPARTPHHNVPTLGKPAMVFSKGRLAAAGSFMFPANAGIENAMWSGLDAAEQIVTEMAKGKAATTTASKL